MNTSPHNNPSQGYVIILATVVAVIIFWIIDKAFLDITPKQNPDFESMYLTRTFFIICISMVFVIGIVRSGITKENWLAHRGRFITKTSWGILTLHKEEPRKRVIISMTIRELIVWTILSLSLFFLIIFLIRPHFFEHYIGSEDQIIEWLSAVFLFGVSIIFTYILILLRRANRKGEKLFQFTAFIFILTFFVLGMEEVSWFQRILLFETPKAFEGNLQGEFNIHNFATGLFGRAYLFSGFVLLIVLPFLNDKLSLDSKSILLSIFLPSRFILFAGSIACAFNYHIWNNLWTQLSFFITLFILISYAWIMRKNDHSFLLPTLIFVYILIQLLFLIYGIKLQIYWAPGECREFFIALAFVLYSLEILERIKKIRSQTL